MCSGFRCSSPLNEIPGKKKSLKLLFLLLQLWDTQQPDSITTQVCRNGVNLVVTMAMQLAFYLISTFVTTDSAVCVYGS